MRDGGSRDGDDPLDARMDVENGKFPVPRDRSRVMSNKERPKSGTSDKVIHVVFGPGGGRVAAPHPPRPRRPQGGQAGAAGSGGPEAPEPPSSKEPLSDLFTTSEVAKLLGVSAGRLRTLDRAGIVAPSGRRKGRRAYTFSDLIALRAARDLLGRRVRLRDVARAIENIVTALPRVTRPLNELRIVSDGQAVVVRSAAGSFEPLTGQMVLDFEVNELRDDVVRVLRPRVEKDRSRTAYDLYMRASQLDEDPETMDDAEALYRRALEIDPWLAIATTNLGNICFRRGDEAQAEVLYRKALQMDPEQPEAQYNLGYVMLDRGQAPEAIAFFKGAIESDPRFADAYYNLAMAYEQVGESAKARPCWRKYLELEPTGTWAEIARKHL
ncbi:TPR domain protein, putative component of TonB system [Chondromyces apiculatus DSM 436]|uniref:TPR domain protein, putative component of TonB system n=2 Tax=Chondromyces apiculatus TaxID=51 RepID=A0A017T0G1_9BACT|nr:TPR domain protein, putative component of TonB system [Chondromyces apiculatus DSM 436]